MILQIESDSLAAVLRLMQEHLRSDSSVTKLVGQTKYDSAVTIQLIVSVAGVFTTAITLIGLYFKEKIAALNRETTAQTGQLQSITTKVNGQLDRAFLQITDLQQELAETRAKGTEGAMKDIAELHAKLDTAMTNIAALRQALTPSPPTG